MMIVRWKFRDTETNEVITLPINPNEASSPTIGRNMEWAWGSVRGVARMRGINLPNSSPGEWTFGGIVRNKAHHDLLLNWARRDSILRVTDHLERTFEIMIQGFEFEERTPRPDNRWRGTFTMSCLFLKEIK